jgi:hypothetical protein
LALLITNSQIRNNINNDTMLFNNLAIYGALVLLPLASGEFQPLGHAGPGGGEFSSARKDVHRFPPRKQMKHGDSRAAMGGPPIPPSHRGLRQRRMQDAPQSTPDKPENSTSRFDCGDSPLVKQETGCPCFTLETITSQVDLTSASYCELYASAPVAEDDQCAYLYPPAYGSFSASTETGDFSLSFGFDSHYDPQQTGGFCRGDISSSLYNNGVVNDNGEYSGDYEGESHSFSLGVEVTEAELDECKNVFEGLKTTLASYPNCLVETGSGYYID